jgi:hypothetical protein
MPGRLWRLPLDPYGGVGSRHRRQVTTPGGHYQMTARRSSGQVRLTSGLPLTAEVEAIRRNRREGPTTDIWSLLRTSDILR